METLRLGKISKVIISSLPLKNTSTWHKSFPLFHEPLGANSKLRDGVRKQNSSWASYRGEGQAEPWRVAAFLFFSSRNFARALRFRLHFLYLAITGEKDTFKRDKSSYTFRQSCHQREWHRLHFRNPERVYSELPWCNYHMSVIKNICLIWGLRMRTCLRTESTILYGLFSPLFYFYHR